QLRDVPRGAVPLGALRRERRARPGEHGDVQLPADRGAFTRAADGTYRVDFPKMRAGIEALAATILVYQGNGDYAGVQGFMRDMGIVRPQLRADLGRLGSARIPVDIVFEQGE